VGGVVFVGDKKPLWSPGEGSFSGYEIHQAAVELVFGRGAKDEVRLRFSPRESSRGRGLALSVRTTRQDPFRLRLGMATAAVPKFENDPTSGRSLCVLEAPEDCAVCVTGIGLVAEGRSVELQVEAAAPSEAILWFVTAASDPVRRELLEGR